MATSRRIVAKSTLGATFGHVTHQLQDKGLFVSEQLDMSDSKSESTLPLRLGLTTPVLSMLPSLAPEWEKAGTIDDVVKIATCADRLGYDHLTCSEHIVVPNDVAQERGGRYFDPLATFGYLAAMTTSLRFATNVLVLGYHHPLEIAKRYGTLDAVTNGRLILGLGVGTLKEEFEILGVPYDNRGARADDALKALRASMSTPTPTYSGEFYQFSDVLLDPCAVQDPVPLWIGGQGARSLRRAVELGDGWAPFGLKAPQIKELLQDAQSTQAWNERTEPLEIVLRNGRALDPVRDRDGAMKIVINLIDTGATVLQCHFEHDSLSHYLEQLEAFAEVVSAYR